MPKRILDDSFLDSRSMEVLSPRAQDAFPRFILLADDFGCFEVNARVLWAKGWSRRPDVTEDDVAGWIIEYAEKQAIDTETGGKLAPVLMVWTHVGRRYAFLTGWFGLHGQKRRAEYDANAPAGTPGRHGSKRKTPPPPGDLLAEVLAGTVRAVDGKPPGTDRDPTGNPDEEIPSDSRPARELTGNVAGGSREKQVSRSFPAPAVPVAVPDAAAAGRPDRQPPEEHPFPLTERYRYDLAARLARTAPHPVGGGREVLEQGEAALRVLGVEPAVELSASRVFEAVKRGDRQPGTLKFFVQAILADAVTARRATPPKTRTVVGVDGNGQPIFEERA